MRTNLDLDKDDALARAGQALLDAAMDYWKEYRKATGGAAVVWVDDTDGRMVILTRGEYRETLLRNVDQLHGEGGRIYNFGTSAKEPDAVK